MALPSSGSAIAFSQIETEFGQNSDRDLGEYRVSQTVGDLSNQPLDTGVPQSGAIKFSNFYSKRLNVIIDYYSGSTENRPDDARTKYQAASKSGNRTVIGFPATKDRISGNSSGSKVRIHVNKTIGSAVGNVNNCAVRTGSFETGTVVTVEVGSSGKVYGAGGNGGHGGTGESSGCGSSNRDGCNGDAGTSGLGVQYSGTTVINNGVISAGYGGGGGGGYRKVEREENWGGPVWGASGGGGGGGQGLPVGEGGGGSSSGADGTTTAGGNGGNGGENNQAHGGGGGGGGSNGNGGEGGNGNDGAGGGATKGGDGASGTHTGSIENENNVTGGGGTGGGNGAAIRRTSGITVNIPSTSGITGATDATGVS